MTASYARHSKYGPFSRAALLLAALMAAGRVGQLAFAPAPVDRPVAAARAGGSGSMPHSAADAELAALYAHCPMASTVDLHTVIASHEQPAALVPAHRETANRVMRPPRPPLEPAVPRIRYPVPLHATPNEEPRIAQSESAGAQSSAIESDWLVDPGEWYAPEEQAKLSDDVAEMPSPKQTPPNEQAPVDSPSTDQPPTKAPQFPAVETLPPPPPTEPVPSQNQEFVRGVSEVKQSEIAEGGSNTEPILQLPSVSQRPPAFVETPPESPAIPAAPAFAPPSLPQSAAQETLPLPGSTDAASVLPKSQAHSIDPHLALFANSAYPSARECAACHEDIYHEWSMSAHAYAAVSPMFHKFEQKLNDLTHGTVGYFCMRCHAPVATDLCASRDEPLWNLPEVAREGITCIACHRVQYAYGESNGERRIEPGDVFAPVFGGIGGEGVAETIHRKAEFKVKTSPHEQGPGQNIHAAGIYFEPLTRSEFCTPCHQVAVHPGIKLEVVWEQYRASPACKKGIQCQDCHMGRVPGLPQGYNIGAVAKVSGKTVNEQRKKSNHVFYGPNYSIAHPGVFPFHLKADRWTIDQWLAFDWRAGWGTEEFENRVADGDIVCNFPAVWAEADDRYDAREIIEENLAKLNHKRQLRIQTMENGSHVEGPFFESAPCRGQDIGFHYIVTNTNEGHNLLTASLGAQPQLWANVVLIGPDGCRLWETGYTDSCGDLANIHSVDVRHKRLPFDWQLFNLQTMFLITGAKGTDREFPVPVNVDIDQLPFIRPGAQPISTINHPPFIRMESQSLAPLAARRVPYRIPGALVQQPGRYRLSFRMRSRAEPIYFMRFCNATPEMERSMNEWMIDVHPISVEFEVR